MLHGFDNYSVLESVDAHTTVLYHRRPAGICTSSRDCVLLRTWRRDVDGSYIILLQDTEHPAAPGPSGELIGGTVRAKVGSGVHTVGVATLGGDFARNHVGHTAHTTVNLPP